MSQPERQSIAVETPQIRDQPESVKIEEIPLPPQELWNELDNSRQTPDEKQQAAPAIRRKQPVERLEFLQNAETTIPLAYPFRRNGEVVDKITMRRLTVGELGDVIDSLPDNFDNYDIYAAMCGLPSAVLRGLIDVDGDKIMEIGYDFLPRLFRPKEEETNGSESV